MLHRFGIPFWKQAPFIRMLVPLIAGIAFQWYVCLPVIASLAVIIVTTSLFVCYTMLSSFGKLKYRIAQGAIMFILQASLGACLIYYKDIRNDNGWLGHYYSKSDSVTVVIDESLIEKPRSFKANAFVLQLSNEKGSADAKGKIIVYFKKDSATTLLGYGSQIVFNKPLQQIKNYGSPGSFDYKRYCLFQNITHQVYLKSDDFIVLHREKEMSFDKFLLNIQSWTVHILQRYIPGKQEQGLAEALLIGYKNDLDKSLVQSYTNTGVVHVIAISGLHLALVYWILIRLFDPLKKLKQARWLHPVIVISGLWLFSLLAGAQASILRAAVMFTLMILAELFARKANILNSLAASAFIMLCYDPFWLWDVGFQLSYAALLSLTIFMKPVYKLCLFENRLLDFIWGLIAASIAAQILTTPISVYHFHQFPCLFIFSNIIAVPLSTLIVFAEIFLCAFSWLHPVAVFAGKSIATLIQVMNTWIKRIQSIPYSLINGLQISFLQTILLFVLIAGISVCVLQRSKNAFWTTVYALVLFILFCFKPF